MRWIFFLLLFASWSLYSETSDDSHSFIQPLFKTSYIYQYTDKQIKKNARPAEFFSELDSFYKLRPESLKEFYNKPNKKMVFYVQNKDQGANDKLWYKLRACEITDELKQIFSQKVTTAKTAITYKNGTGPVINLTDGDIIVVLDCEVVSTAIEYMGSQVSTAILDLNLSYRIYLPEVFGRDPVGNFFIKESFTNKTMQCQKLLSLLKDKLQKIYAWEDIGTILKYLDGKSDLSHFLKIKWNQNPDDIFALKLLTLTRPAEIQKELLQNGRYEELIKTSMLSPYDKQLGSGLERYIADNGRYLEKVSILYYLYINKYPDLQNLLNDILAETDTREKLEYIGPALYLCTVFGNDETLEYLKKIYFNMVEINPGLLKKSSIDLLKTSIGALERKPHDK
ncbi:MAG: hypothetical protein PHV30_05925 [Candidatus Margulisbacteria bacterium]|nr:hypothetical protein [Candidatus Margulisiibacteriota bacterium]